MRKVFAVGALVLFLFSASLALAGSDRPIPLAPGGAVVGAVAPDITVYDLKGNSISLSSLRGKVVFLNFWATWCPPCRAELPSIDRLYEVFGGNPDFVLLAVNGEPEGRDTVPRFLKEDPHPFPIYLDPDGSAQQRYGVTGYPETYLIGRDGVIVGKEIGSNDWSSVSVLKLVASLLGK